MVASVTRSSLWLNHVADWGLRKTIIRFEKVRLDLYKFSSEMINMKTVMFVIPFLSGGGAERVVSIWASNLAKLGVNTYVVVFYRVENEYPVHHAVRICSIVKTRESYDRLSGLRKVKLLREQLKAVQPDIVLPFVSYVGIMTNLARIGLGRPKVVETIRNNPHRIPKKRMFRVLRNASVALAHGCIVQNEEQKSYFPRCLQGKMRVFTNPISDEFLQSDVRSKGAAIKRITTVGRLVQQKNHRMLIRAFAQLDNLDLSLRIYGDGPEKQALQDLVDSLGLGHRVKLCGRTTRILEVLTNTDLFVLSSDVEGMPNALMEAMAVGIPCISTDCPTGPSDIIDNGHNGILIPVGDEHALVAAMKLLVQNPNLAWQMGARAKEKMKACYAADQSAKALLEYLIELC
jgi:glycosyltransferase involved in cell wall biosynthesis